MVNTREEAVKNSLAAHTNVPDTCQLMVRTWLGAPSAGDQDHDGDADAVDGWKSEPAGAKHTDRHPPAGVPVAWSGGSHGHGHRALSLGDGKIRSTDAAGEGHVATVDLDWPEKHWGLHYEGWSETIDGQKIPEDKPVQVTRPVVTPPQNQTATDHDEEPATVSHIKKLLQKAHKRNVEAGNEGRAAKLKDSIDALPEKKGK